MRRFYANLKGMLATLIFASMMLVSCHDCEVYDDTEIRDKIADLYELISQLEDRIDDEVETLTTLINSKTVIADAVQNADGSWTLLLSDGKSITVYPQYQPEDPAPEQNNGCITVVAINGEYYWAIIEEGEPVALKDENNNLIPVVNGGPIFKVNDQNELMFSLDGENWYPVAEESEAADCTCIIVDIVDTGDAVLFYLVSGDVITVKKAAEIDFGFKSGKKFVAPGESVDVKLIANNIYDLTVIAKPEGWKSTIDGKTLTITAPAQEKIDAQEAELEGVIKIHAAGEDGKCMVGKLVVSASSVALTIDIEGDNMTIYNGYTDKYDPTYSLAVCFGIMLESEFSAEYIVNDVNNMIYEVDYLTYYESEINMTLLDLYNQVNYNSEPVAAIPTGHSYVVWAFVRESYDDISEDDIVFETFTPQFVSMEATEISIRDIEVSLKAGGYDSYQYGVMSEVESESDCLDNLSWRFDDWKNGYSSTFGETTTEFDITGSITLLDQYLSVKPGCGYCIYVLPMSEGKAIADYTIDDVELLFVRAKALEPGGSSTLEFAPTVESDRVSVNITASEDTQMIYAKIYEADELIYFDGDEDVLDNLIAYCNSYNSFIEGNQGEAVCTSLRPETSVTLYAIAVDGDGKYGKIYKEQYTTPAIQFNENLVITIDEAGSTFDISSANIKFNVTGGEPVRYKYIIAENSEYDYVWGSLAGGSVEAAEQWLAISENVWGMYNADALELASGEVYVNELTTGAEYVFMLMAVDADDKPSRAASIFFTPSLPDYTLIRNNDERWSASKPQYEIKYTVNEWDEPVAYFVVTPGEKAVKCWATISDADYFPVEDITAKESVDNLLLGTSGWFGYGGSVEFTEEFTSDYVTIYEGYDLYFHLAWMDAEGNYYQAYIEKLESPVAGE